jgi:hypothetical protein
MNFEIYGWMVVLSLGLLMVAILSATWIVAVENGYDRGFKTGYKRGQDDKTVRSVHTQKVTFSYPVTMANLEKRNNQLRDDNDYLMGKVVSLWDKENN